LGTLRGPNFDAYYAKLIPFIASPPGSPDYTKILPILSMKNTPSMAGRVCLETLSSDGFFGNNLRVSSIIDSGKWGISLSPDVNKVTS